MTAFELRTSAWLASLFALRMLGLFLILPVFAIYARELEGGKDAALVGLAMGIYGLTQGMLQIPFGWASDRWGRKPVMTIGLLLFAAGSFVCAYADTLTGMIVGRAIQGSGAISAAVTATIADHTRDSVRTKAMAMVGGSIALTFALSLVLSPVLAANVGLKGLFLLMGFLVLSAIAVVQFAVPGVKAHHTTSAPHETSQPTWRDVLSPDLLRLNVGIFVLHAMQMAMFVAIPLAMLKVLGLPNAEHWKIYLPVVLASFVALVPAMLLAERKGHARAVFRSSVALILLTMLGFAFWVQQPVALVLLLLCFFVAFNILESMIPSLVSRQAPAARKGLALGVYNTTQTLGLFVGGAVGGLLVQRLGDSGMFWAAAGASLVWLIICWNMQVPHNAKKTVVQSSSAKAQTDS